MVPISSDNQIVNGQPLADDDAGGLIASRQPLAKGASDGNYCFLVEGVIAGRAPNSVCSE